MTDKGPKPSRRQSHMRLWRMPAMMLAVLPADRGLRGMQRRRGPLTQTGGANVAA